MEYTKLGKSDLMVSRICMGCMGFGDAKTASTVGHWMKSIPVRSSVEDWNWESTFSIQPSVIKAAPANSTWVGRSGTMQSGRMWW